MRDERKEPTVNAHESLKPSGNHIPSLAFHPSSLIFHPSSFLFFIIWFFLLFAGRSAMLRDPGCFWHLVDGQKMLAAGDVLRNDSFSFTFDGQPWVADQWLAECGMAIVHEKAGWDGLLLLSTAMLAAVYAWIAMRLLRGGLHWLPVGLLSAVVLLIGAPQFHVRPLILTIALLGVTFAWLVDVEAGRKRTGQLWWLVPLFILWTNLHGGVLAGIGTVGLCVSGWCIASVFDKTAACRLRRAIGWIFLSVALVATTLMNPYGVDLPRDWLKTLAMPLPDLIVEHTRLNLTEPTGWVTVVLAVGYLAVLIGVLPKRPRIVWLVPLVWFVLAVLRVRNAPLFAVTAALAVADMLPHSRVGRWLARREMLGATKPPAGWRSAVLPTIVVASALMIQMAGVGVPVIGRGWAQFDRNYWPMELLPQLKEINQTSPEGTPIFNDLSLGGFLIYHAPRLRVFIDDRCSLYGEDFLEAYDHARRENPAEIDRWQRQYGFRHAVVESGGKFDNHLAESASWTLLARTSTATLYQYRMGNSPSKH